jgi:hypothetical protein
VRTSGTQSIGGVKTFSANLGAAASIFNTGIGSGSGAAVAMLIGGEFVLQTCDERLKNNIVPTIYSLDDLMQIEVKDFYWTESGLADVGFIAQQLINVVPEAVQYDEAKDQYGMNSNPVIALLVKSVQELTNRVEELEQRLNAE